VERTIQAGKLGHYTWIVDEIMLEEVNPITEASSYNKPFDKVENKQGIPISAMTNDLSEELIGLLGSLVGLNFNVANMPSKQHLQFSRVENKNTKKMLKRISGNQTILQNSEYIAKFYRGAPEFVPEPED